MKMRRGTEGKEKGKSILTTTSGSTWNYRAWEKYGKSRVYFSNDHYAVGNAKLSFFVENGKLNKIFPGIREEQAEILANIENLDFMPDA